MRVLAALAMAGVLCAGGSVAYSAEVLILISSDTGPYKTAADEAERSLKQFGHSTHRQLLTKIDPESLAERSGPVVAIGGNAAVRMAQVLPESTPLYYCMTPHPDRIGLTNRAKTSGVSTDPDILAQVDLIQRSGIRVNRIGLLYKGSVESSKALRDRFEEAMPSGWALTAIDLDSTGSAAASIDLLFSEEIDIVWTAADTAVFDSSLVKALLLRSIRDRIPMFGFSHALVRAGAPFGVGFEPETQGRRVAELLNNGSMSIHEPSDTRLAINATALDRIGLKLSPDLAREAEVRFGSD
ncbi:MAG: hypothetical protein KDA29_14780 [Phycisphaerales bacterium]|nr:hypothetical protein [Phycisphaerales bacterium]